jgi:ABC-type multidrug transport system ATPase subunit
MTVLAAIPRRHAAAESAVLMRVSDLAKQYGEQHALSGISFSVHVGEVLGLIGPNGAGKTTLLEAIAGLVPVDKGQIFWRDTPLPQARRRELMFYLPDGVRPYGDQFVERVLSFFAGAYRKSARQVADVVAAMGLAPALCKRVRALSKGFNRRLILALGFLAPHPVLLMDEPFDGFDLKQTREMMDCLRQSAASGRTLVLSIHQLLDAERVCDRIVLLADGRIRGVGTMDDLRGQTGLPAASLEDVFLALT